ncbi:hypothetical protein LOAG_14119 [Loa loa]|uniref:Uncharacterized protein n=1 Tax=Loa loa TaxID=7209 RepID=A0A1S0TIB5_LOALO|nr:hypothetical protein LOAG_14119 [Loa loa]EFO14400.1 hypothetical protein LOAG_14119 [Loa loa]
MVSHILYLLSTQRSIRTQLQHEQQKQSQSNESHFRLIKCSTLQINLPSLEFAFSNIHPLFSNRIFTISNRRGDEILKWTMPRGRPYLHDDLDGAYKTSL